MSLLPLTALSAAPPLVEDTASLNQTFRGAAKGLGVYIGSQFDGTQIQTNEQYRTMHKTQYALSTVGNDCKWEPTEKKAGDIDLTKCNAAFKYARDNNQAFRAHNLCWGNNNPAWLLNLTGADDLRAALKSHIRGVMTGLKAAAGGLSPYAYDVVNEATNDTAWFKPNTWYPALPDYVDVAFTTAREADNTTLLFYNDFAVVGTGHKAEQMYGMVASMVKRGVPIDGVGLQSHFTLPSRYWPAAAAEEAAEEAAEAAAAQQPQRLVEGAYEDDGLGEKEKLRAPAPTQAEMASTIARYGALGLQVHITELDVKCPDPCTDDALQAQAQVYADILRACLQHPKVCTSFESWGFTDANTWLVGDRCPTTKCHPLPFDEQYAVKPAARQILSVLQQAERPAK